MRKTTVLMMSLMLLGSLPVGCVETAAHQWRTFNELVVKDGHVVDTTLRKVAVKDMAPLPSVKSGNAGSRYSSGAGYGSGK